MKPLDILNALRIEGIQITPDPNGRDLILRPQRGVPPILAETVRRNKRQVLAEVVRRDIRVLERQLKLDSDRLRFAEETGHADGPDYDDRLSQFELDLLRYQRLCRQLDQIGAAA